jgi:uncharacterized protein YcnI
VRRATITLVGAALTTVLFNVLPAWGHAVFEGPSTVPVASDQTITMKVPEERGPNAHNSKVAIEVPTGFTIKSCQAKEEWECSTTVSGTRRVVTFTRSSGVNPDPMFSFSVRTPFEPGDHPFTVIQTYADGHRVIWGGPPDSDTPAPVFKVTVTATPAGPATPEPAPAAAPAAPAPAAPGPAPGAPEPEPHGAPSTPPTVAGATETAPSSAEPEKQAQEAGGLARTGPSRGLLLLSGAALLLGGLGVAGGAHRRAG